VPRPVDCVRRGSDSRSTLNSQFEFQKRRQLFIRTHNKTFSIAATCGDNPDRSPLAIAWQSRDARGERAFRRRDVPLATLKATGLYELCLQYDVEIPGVSPDRRDEEEYGRKIVGGVLSRIFQRNGSPVTTVEIDGFRIDLKDQDIYRDDGKGSFVSRSYKVTLVPCNGEN
jgi:hypothetical protein